MSIKKILNTSLTDSTKLLLHCDGTDGSTVFTDDSSSAHIVTAYLDAQIDTAQKKFGTASSLFDGTGDYLTIPDSTAWDINADYTMDFWVRFNTHAGIEVLTIQYQDSSNYWRLYHGHTTGWNFTIFTSGVNNIIMAGGGEITDSNWHHIVLCRVGNDYGIYVDGNQVNYDSDPAVTTFNAILRIGVKQNLVQYFNGHLDEFRIKHSNAFNASPNVGLTDTITVPTSAYNVIEIGKVFNINKTTIAKISGVTK